jgi:transposase
VSLSQGDVFLSCPGAVDLGVLLPHLAGVVVEDVAVAAGLLLVTARARAATAACPGCGAASGRVHSRYSRTLADAAIGGRQVEIVLAVRRFFCAAPDCRRKTFAEQVDGLTGQDLPQWIAAAREAGLPGIASFAKGLEQDLDAVTNGLTTSWSSGPVEGRVNHIKMVKRQTFGRAGLALLRKRVLLTARR